jgi:hypothetical protein
MYSVFGDDCVRFRRPWGMVSRKQMRKERKEEERERESTEI